MFRDYIHEHSGIFLDESKLDSLRISLHTRASRTNCFSYNDYFQILKGSEEEFRELISLITINETSFFRYFAQFEVFRNNILPDIIRRKEKIGNKSLRIWSAGCSTGEEPYTVALIILDGFPEILTWNIEILGTDVSKKALSQAKEGFYHSRSLRITPQRYIDKYFEPSGDGFQIKDEVKRMVNFKYHNLVKEPYPLSVLGSWDVIFCRNVTIYFKPESTKRVVRKFYESLNDDGYLLIGHSETLYQISSDFVPIEINGLFVYQKQTQKSWLTQLNNQYISHLPSLRKAPVKLIEIPEEEKIEADEEIENLLGKAVELLNDGKNEEAKKLLKKIFKQDEKIFRVHLLLARIYADEGKFDQSVNYCHNALKINPMQAAPHYLLGLIYKKQGKITDAIDEFRKTIYLDENFALAHIHLAQILQLENKLDEATRELRNAINAMNRAPEGEWLQFSGGYNSEFLIRTCQEMLKKIKPIEKLG